MRVYWPAMYREVRDYISSCERCTMGHAPALHTTSSRLLASRPLELLAIDLTKLETASDGREKLMFLFSPMFSRSSPRPYRRATRRQGEWPRCWFTSGSNATGSPRRSTVTRVGTLSLSWWNPCVSSMASRRPGPFRITPVATHSASDSIVRCMICCEPCPRNRSPSGHSTSWSLWRRITISLTLPRGFRLLFGQERQHRLRLQDSHARALKHLQEAAAERWKQMDQKAADHPLHVSDLVYLRNSVLGRSKIQDQWRPELHVPIPAYVYGVKPFSGADPQLRWPVACQGTIGGCCYRGTNTGNTCSGQPTVPRLGWVLAGSACDCWLASSRTHSCCPCSCCTHSRCIHSCSWCTASQSQTCTRALHPCEQRGKKTQCCQPTSNSSVATVMLRCSTVYIYYIMIELWWLDC